MKISTKLCSLVKKNKTRNSSTLANAKMQKHFIYSQALKLKADLLI